MAGLIAAHDEIASASGSFSTVDDYRAELARRGIDKQASTMLCLTWVIEVLTLANVAYPVLNRKPPQWMTPSVRNVAVISSQAATPNINPVITRGMAT